MSKVIDGTLSDGYKGHMDAETLDLVRRWKVAKEAAQSAQAEERALRDEIEKRVFSGAEKGTLRADLTDGWKLKCVKKINVGFISREAVDAALDKIERTPEAGGELIASRLIKWTPEFVQKEFDAAPEAAQKILSEVLVRKPAAPTLEIEAPKEPK